MEGNGGSGGGDVTLEYLSSNYYSNTESDLRFEQLANKGIANGYVPLNAQGQIDPTFIPASAIFLKVLLNKLGLKFNSGPAMSKPIILSEFARASWQPQPPPSDDAAYSHSIAAVGTRSESAATSSTVSSSSR